MRDPRKGMTRKAKNAREGAGIGARMLGAVYGDVVRKEYKIGLAGRHAAAITIGVTGHQGGLSGDPALRIAYRIRNALDPTIPPRAPATIYNAAGQPVATMDPYTRERRPL